MKWYGDIGFKTEVEEEPGVWVPRVVTHPYYGDILQVSWKEQQAEKINADLHISNRLSVIADQQLQKNFHKIAYVTVNYPRLTLDLGSLYLGEEEEDVED